MVTYQHEIPLRLLQANPKLATELYCGLLGERLPEYTDILAGSEALTRCDRPLERNCDNLEVFLSGKDPVFALIFEVQRAEDPEKLYSWPDYLISARTRLRCPVALVVICPDEKTARWVRHGVDTGHPGFVLIPLVIGPDQIPVITDPERARESVEMTIYSLLAHGEGRHGEEIMRAYYAAVPNLDQNKQDKYTRFALNALSEEARQRLEAIIMSDETSFGSNLLDRIEAKGEARGERKSLLAVLEARGIPVDESTRARIDTCDETEQIVAWLVRAASADSITEVFD
ncbi:hypothetical protein AB0B28_04660 [Glycomyces sp. NPDC046736]|uniref:hypothetical protein n=1 Tax=Glycomyces sp. NPDC046736 TaxID=3155615 RepID=UPI0033E8E8B2